ncbi:hypothetical protein NQZ68_005360 [Dissostichus eleginoides]|nr:hypothetical protein NQZ68_005351 [Dissostichus eleginoides]KAI9539281.1 hypothetical protein NQZ68_005360 [Dissostichus eleginoides]
MNSCETSTLKGLRSLWPSSPRSDKGGLLDRPPVRRPPLCSQWRYQSDTGGNPLYGTLRQSKPALLEFVHKTLHTRVELPVEVSQGLGQRLDPGHM